MQLAMVGLGRMGANMVKRLAMPHVTHNRVSLTLRASASP